MSYHFNYDIDYKDNFIFDILKYINLKNIFKSIKNKTKYDYILELYLKLYECYCNIENDKFYYEYKNLFLENLNKLNEDSRAFHFGVLINLCLRKNNLDTSKDEFVNEEFNLYEIILQNEYYKEGKINYLPTYYFRAILFSALKLKKFDWVQNFIEKYSNNVPEEDRENIYNFGNAYLYFEKGEYNSSARHLLKISIDQFVFKFDIRNLTLKIFYELEDYDKAFEVLHSYKEFLRDSKLMTKDNKMLLLKYINYTEKFMLYKTGQRTIDIGRIKHNLQKEDKVAFKNWLIDKADELIQIGKKRVLAS